MRTGRPFFVMACFSHFFFCKYQNQRHDDAAHVSLTFANECAAHEINPQTRRRPLSRPEHPKPSTSRARPLPPRAPRARRQPRARAPLNRRVPYASTPSHHHARPRPPHARTPRANQHTTSRITSHSRIARTATTSSVERPATGATDILYAREKITITRQSSSSATIASRHRVAGAKFVTHQSSARETPKGLGSRPSFARAFARARRRACGRTLAEMVLELNWHCLALSAAECVAANIVRGVE